jgi:hypothetical protein
MQATSEVKSVKKLGSLVMNSAEGIRQAIINHQRGIVGHLS